MSDPARAARSSYLTWLMSFMACFGSCFRWEGHSADEKQLPLFVDSQPSLHSTTVSTSKNLREQGQWKTKGVRNSTATGRTSFSARSWFWSDGSSRRPLISAPSNYRHIDSGALQFPPDMYETPTVAQLRTPLRTRDDFEVSRREGQYFQPLELSIYAPAHRISPILPHFDFPRIPSPPPPPAYCVEGTGRVDRQLVHQHSYSSMSFHVPRRRPGLPVTPGNCEDSPPTIPPKSRNRPRAYTAPEMDAIKERVASALIEVEMLQKQIDDVIERQSIYVNSRPSTSHSTARTVPGELLVEKATATSVRDRTLTEPGLEPMPSIPALPPAAPSFAERLNSETDRPQTAPVRVPSLAGPPSRIAGGKAPSIENDKTETTVGLMTPLAPPLPLVLRPPLRKKKSFSRASSWLFPHKLDVDGTADSVTNNPKPVKEGDGFYQPVASQMSRRSCDSLCSSSTWGTGDGMLIASTNWSADASSAVNRDDVPQLDRIATFGKDDMRLGKAAAVVSPV